jgi:very-short-patch-repair endonuclease
VPDRLARNLRLNPTDAERLLWSKINNNQLGVKFRRQHPLGNYIVDFICLDKRLVIELDGGHRNEQANLDKDSIRSDQIIKMGYRVARFWNNDVLQNIEGVVLQIQSLL